MNFENEVLVLFDVQILQFLHFNGSVIQSATFSKILIIRDRDHVRNFHSKFWAHFLENKVFKKYSLIKMVS